MKELNTGTSTHHILCDHAEIVLFRDRAKKLDNVGVPQPRHDLDFIVKLLQLLLSDLLDRLDGDLLAPQLACQHAHEQPRQL